MCVRQGQGVRQVHTSHSTRSQPTALSPCLLFPPSHTLCPLQEVLDWFAERKLHAYSISAGQSLLYNDIFPKHKERLGKKMSELVVSVMCDLVCVRVFFVITYNTGCCHRWAVLFF